MNDVVSPLYQTYVLQNGDVLQRSTGLSLAYLVTLEVLEQFNEGRVLFQQFPRGDEEPEDRHRQIDRYLRLLGAKQKYTDLLVRLQSWRENSIMRHVHPPAS